MKFVALVLFVIFVSFALSTSAQTGKPFVPKDGAFSIVPPSGFEELKYQKHTRTTEGGEIEMNQYSLTLDRGTCLISHYDLHERILQTKSADLIFSDSVAALLRQGDATISNQKNLTIDGHPAMSFDLRTPNRSGSLYTHAVLVFARPRAYNFIFASADLTQLTRPDVLNFFRSIHIGR